MPHLEPLGVWVAGLRYRDLPEPTVRAARYQILDMLAAAHGAARMPDVRAAAAAVADFAGPGRATALATGARLGPADAALANAVCSIAQDFDDIVWMGHTCHSAVFAPLAVAEHEGASSEALVTAVVAANEIGGRIGASACLGPLNGQMWTFIHLVGAAAAAASLLGLDAARTTHALGIALAQPNFALQPGFMAPTSKLLAAATPTAAGIQAAYFARAGMTGAADILEDRRGFWRRFSFVPMANMLGRLGEHWVTQTLTIKSYPGCHYFQTASAAIDRLVARLGPLARRRIGRVRVDTTKVGMEVTRFARDYAPTERIEPVNVNFDLATSVAIHLLAGRLTGTEMDPAWLAERTPAIRELVARTRVHHDPALTARILASGAAVGAGRQALATLGARELVGLVRRYRDEYGSTLITPRELLGWVQVAARRRRAKVPVGALYFPNRVTIEVDGRRETEEVDLPPGSFAAPTCLAELERKVLVEAAPALGDDGARALIAAGQALPRTSVAELVASCARRPRSAA
jgi:2-methylcitrate dehydratase PrpD